MDEQIGAADPGGKASGQREPFALGATVNMRGCGEIGGANASAASVTSEQVLDARAVSAGSIAENTSERRGAVAARGAG